MEAHFGGEVILSGYRAIISACGNDTGASNAGAVYVYDLQDAEPVQPVTILQNPAPAHYDRFGLTALSGSILAVGFNPDTPIKKYEGDIRFYDLDSLTPSQAIRSLPRPALSTFGFSAGSLSFGVGKLFVGLPLNSDQAAGRGAVLVFGPDSIPPGFGTFLVTPGSPVKPTTQLTAHFEEWNDDSLPLTYSVRVGDTVLVPPGENSTPTFSLPAGSHLVYGRITDGAGNVNDTATSQIVVDGAGPIVGTLPNLTVEAIGSAGSVVNFNPNVTDDFDPNPAVVASPASGSVFPIGTTVVEVVATDHVGNLAVSSFTVTVQDTVAPVIGGAFPISRIVAGTPLSNYAENIAATDAVGVVAVTQTPLPGTITSKGEILVTITARDAANNSSNVSFKVIVRPVNAIASVLASNGDVIHPSAGLEAGALWHAFGVPAVNEAGDVAFLGKWLNGKQRGEGVWVRRAGSEVLEKIVLRGELVPGAGSEGLPAQAKIGALQDPVIAANGDALVPVGLVGRGLSAARGTALLWSPGADRASSRLALRVGGELAGSGGAQMFLIQGVAFDTGGLAFHGKLKRGSGMPRVTLGNDSVAGVWDPENGPRILLREGRPLAGSTLGSFYSPVAGEAAPGHSRGWASIQPGASPRLGLIGKLMDGTQAVFRTEENVDDVIFATTRISESGLAPLAGTTFKKLGVSSWTEQVGTPALAATLPTGERGVFRIESGDTTVLQLEGGELEPDITVKRVGDPIVSPDGAITAWRGTLGGKKAKRGNDQAIFIHDGDPDARILVRAGDQAADCAAGAFYHQFTSFALSRQGVLLLGKLRPGGGQVTAGNDDCLWAHSITGELRLVLREGQMIEGRSLKRFTVLKAVPGTIGVRRAFSDSGFIVALATFVGGATAIVEVQLP